MVRLYISCKYDVGILIKMGHVYMDMLEYKVKLYWLNGEKLALLEQELELKEAQFKNACLLVGADFQKVLAVVRLIRKRHLYDETYDDFTFSLENVSGEMRNFFAMETEL